MSHDRIVMYTKIALHTRLYLRTEVFDRRTYPPGSMEWMWSTLAHQARESEKTPRHAQDIAHLARGLHIASQLPSWQSLGGTPTAEVTVEQAIAFNSEFEAHLLETIGDNHTSARLSAIVRTLVATKLQAESQDTRMTKLRKLYQPRCITVSRGRALISDIAHGNRPPIQALPHNSAAELRQATQLVLQWDLDQVRRVALDVLNRYTAAVTALNRWECIPIENAQEVRVRSLVARVGCDEGKDDDWSEEDIDCFIALELAIKRGEKPPFDRAPFPLRLYAKNVADYAQRALHGVLNGASLSYWLDLREAPPGEVLLSCGLIIQIKTAWNFISVLELLPEATKVNAFPHRLQSIKPRTKDETPLVFVERRDEDVLIALGVLRDRYDRLVQKGIREPTLWASSRSVRQGHGNPFVGWGVELRSFCERYGLPNFSLEMVRGQVLAAEAAASGDLSRARSMAGHTETGTTFGYVNKLLLQRMNAANLYEFEKRFDATVQYLIDPTAVAAGQCLLSYPIGDGASCKDPSHPPHDQWLRSGVCSGERCHKDGGCPNRTLEITHERIEEVVRTKLFYEKNWNRLLNENEIAFERLHLPKLEFTFALYGVIRRGPYRHLLNKHENLQT